MRDEPQGRFVSRMVGKPVTAKRFHLYKDCGSCLGSEESDGQYEVINLDGVGEEESTASIVIEMLGLTVCNPCKNRSEEVSAEDVLAEVLGNTEIEEVLIYPAVADRIATRQVVALEAAGYKIRRVRRGG